MSYLRKIIAWLLVFAILIFSLRAPAFATADPPPADSRGNFFDWALRPGGSFGGGIGGGRFTNKEDYDKWVDSLPAPGYSSDGLLYWKVPIISYSANVGSNVVSFSKGMEFFVVYQIRNTNTYIDVVSGGFLAPIHGTHGLRIYSQSSSPDCGIMHWQGSFGLTSGSPYFSSGKFYSIGNPKSFVAGETVVSQNSRLTLDGKYDSAYPFYTVSGYLEVFCTPLTLPGDIYNSTSRPTAINGGNYGIVGDNGQITTVTNHNQIINETNNTYYNPATGQTQAITDWTYNYDGRIYDITLDTGDKVSVEYGDQNITITENTINEGDTIVNNYTIYYIIDGGSGETPGPSPTPGPEATPCPHAWAETSRTDPSCTAPGSASFSCSRCGETKTDKLPATGHTWQILRTVQTAYDEEGNLVQQGYTIYQCAVCSEQYKDDQGTGPPGGGQEEDKETIWDKIASFFGSIVDGIAGIFEAILGKLLDALTALSELLMGKVKDVVEVVLAVFDELPKLFGGFLDFLALIFPFLPAEITLLLTFGVIAVVFTGIIKALRR